MIYAKISDLNRLCCVETGALQKITQFLNSVKANSPEGKTELLPGQKLYVSIQHYDSHALNADKLEAHREYADIQLVLAGKEKIAYEDVEGKETVSAYAPAKDVFFCRAVENGESQVALVPGMFALLFPGEGHLPGLGDGQNVVKVVVKIHKSLLK